MVWNELEWFGMHARTRKEEMNEWTNERTNACLWYRVLYCGVRVYVNTVNPSTRRSVNPSIRQPCSIRKPVDL